MPRYDFVNIMTGDIKEYTMKIAELDQFKKDNPHLKQKPAILNTITAVEGAALKKAGDGWKEVQDRIKKGLPERYAKNIHTK